MVSNDWLAIIYNNFLNNSDCAGHKRRMPSSRFRIPVVSEQHVLEHVRVRLVAADDVVERGRFRSLIEKHHYLKSDTLVGEQLR